MPTYGIGSWTQPAVGWIPASSSTRPRRGEARETRETAAKAVCAACPVRTQCLEHALAVREPYGVWGGLSEHEAGRLIAARRSRRIAAC